MLSEGWDAANVTHIMGLRAFTSQLLCEQVIGRGLRRVAHDLDADGRFLPEFVNVFGVPLSIFQEVGEGGETPPVPKSSVRVAVEPGRNHLEIQWPNVVRIQAVLKPELVMDWDRVEPLTLDPNSTSLNADIAPSLTGVVNLAQASAIELEHAAADFRLQNLIFRAIRKLYRELGDGFSGEKQYLAMQLIRLVERFLNSDQLAIPTRWHAEPLRRRSLIALNMDRIVGHVSRYVTRQNTTTREPLFDEQQPIGSTATMRPWLTTKPCQPTVRSQISHAVHDSSWEQAVVYVCEHSEDVAAWAKNDHLDFVVRYLWNGSSRNFVPDYLIRLGNGKTLVLEVKGQDSDRNRAKRAAMMEWVNTINATGGFGTWCFDTVFDPAATRDAIARHCESATVTG
jgi:type III restriction enzyme